MDSAHTARTDDHLHVPNRSVDEAGGGGHICEHIAGRDGCEKGQQPGRWLPERTLTRAGSAQPATAEAMSSAPASRIALPTCPRLPLQCTRALFTVAVDEAAYLRATRQTSRKESRARSRIGWATRAPAQQARPRQRARLQRSAECSCSSTGSTHDQKSLEMRLRMPSQANDKQMPFPGGP